MTGLRAAGAGGCIRIGRRRVLVCMTPPTVPARPREARRIRQRLFERVADADDSHLTEAADDGPWQPLADGVQIKVLHQAGDTMSYLLRLAPGATLPPHRHPMDEECIVLAGWLQVGSRLRVGPGGYHRAHAGALHATLRSDSGATLFLRGAVPQADHVLG
jgi:quercetin dioxygenase-like cupin family protein